MTPTLRQRLGLDPIGFGPRGRERLTAARAAAGLYAGLATLTLVAAAISGDLRESAFVIAGGAVLAYVISATILLAYERLSVVFRYLLAVAGSAIVAVEIYALPNGVAYAPLYTWLVLYVGFFYPRRQAFLQISAVAASLVVALFLRYGVQEALGHWVLLAGVLGGAGVITTILRGRLDVVAGRAFEDRASLKAFFDHAAGGFALLDAELRFNRVNTALAEIIGRPPEELVGLRLSDVSPVPAVTLEPLLRSVLDTGEALVGIEVASEDGLGHHLVALYPVDGTNAIGMSVVDVTRLKHAEHHLTATNRQLTVLATTDELTGLPNRRALSEQLDLAFARARRGGLGVALLSIDLDEFKSVNDTFGHAYGDRLLAEAANQLRRGARDTDVVARIGGDEFVVLLADLAVQEALTLAETVAERIRELLSTPISIPPVELRADASVGIAIYPFDAKDPEGLLAAADAAMYVSKSTALRVA